MRGVVRTLRISFLTNWQASGTTCLYHPHHIGKGGEDFFQRKERCGKGCRSVEHRQASGSQLCFLQLTDLCGGCALLKEKFRETAIVQLKYGCYGMIYAVGI